MPKKRSEQQKRAEFEQAAWIHLDAMFNMAMKLTRNRAEAEDLVQETYMRAFRFFDQYEPGTNCKAWLFRILRNNFINRYRSQKQRPETIEMERVEYTLGTDADPGRAPGWADPEKSFEGEAVRRDIESALDELPPDYRTVVVLSAVEGLSYREIASIMDTPIGTVMSRLHRARRQLQGRLAAHLPPPAAAGEAASGRAAAGPAGSRDMEDS